MKKTLISLSLSVAIALNQSADASAFKRADFKGYTQALQQRASTATGQWHKTPQANASNGMQRVVTEADAVIPPASYWGSLTTPGGEEWMYTMEYTYAPAGEYFETITAASITIYDADFNVYRKLNAEFTLGENETSINSVQIAPQLTKKFFNINDAYEVMLFIHATTADYTGHIYTQVYTLADGTLVDTLEGDNIAAFDMATDSWSEKYTMIFMRESTEITEDDYNYMLYFDVYSRAGWDGGCKLEHTFAVDYKYIAGAGNYALPILVNKSDNRLYYALPHYEKEYFVSSFEEDVTPDNHFIIDLYDDTFKLIKTTSIPMEVEGEAIFSFPGLGELRGFDDMCFDFYGETSALPYYVVGVENYIASTDDFKTSFYVYDADGNRLQTIVENADDYLAMSPVAGREDQYCFYFADENAGEFRFIDIPSCNVAATIPLMLDGQTISTSIDRAASGGSYKYVSSMLMGEVDLDGNVNHKIAWFNEDGSFNRIDRINLGKDAIMAQVNIQGDALVPYLFNTDGHIEYMFLVKEQDPETYKSKEYFRIYNDQSEMLLNFGPNEETGESLNSIFVTSNANSSQKLVISYYADDNYRLHTLNLPLEMFAGGNGTSESPYKVATAGDVMAMHMAPAACYEMTNDIDFGNTPWTGNDCIFTGVFDGKGYTISNLNLTGCGIFKSITEKGTFKNVNVNNVKAVMSHNGGIIAESIDNGDKEVASVSNVHLSNVTVTATDDVTFGCIAAYVDVYSMIENCSVTDAHLDFGKKSSVGGVVGCMSTSAQVKNSLFDGWINAREAGGIAGSSMTGDEVITNCHAHAEIEAENIGGGIIGSSSRTIINNCFVDGNINANGNKEAYSGGIAGYLNPLYDDVKNMVITNCIVAANVKFNDKAKDSASHLIAGFTSGDEKLVDWESTDPNVDWSNPATYPYINGEPEKALSNNFVIVEEGTTVEDEGDNMPNGKIITKEALNDDFLIQHNWAISEVWKKAGTALALVQEDFTVTADADDISISGDDVEEGSNTITFTLPSRYAHLLEITSSDDNVARVGEIKYSEDGKSAVCHIEYVSAGQCDITAANDSSSAVCHVTTKATTIVDVTATVSTIIYDGKYIYSAGNEIQVYDTAGRMVASGYETVSAQQLASGVYFAVNGIDSLKIVK